MKTARLLLIAICSLSVYCSFGQTNEDVFAQYARETYKLASWGTATNNIQFGVRICAVGPTEADKFKVVTYLCNTNSTTIYGLWRLAPGYRLKMTLKTKDGKEILKTSKGNALCKSPFWDIRSGGSVVVLNPKDPQDYDETFDLRDSFKIKKADTYILTVKPMLYAMKGYKEFVKLDIPEASIEVTLPAPDSR